MDLDKELIRGTTFYVEKLIPGFVWDKEDNKDVEYKSKNSYNHGGIVCGFEICPYCADVNRTRKQLIFKIFDTETSSLIKINGIDTFVFDLRPHTESEEGDEKGYDYRPQKGYGLYDYEKYDGCGLYATIKCLIIDLIESSLRLNSDDEV